MGDLNYYFNLDKISKTSGILNSEQVVYNK